MYYRFDRPLTEGTIVKRQSQFSFLVEREGERFFAHCPTTGRIGDVETKNIACLLSKSEDGKRKMPYTVEAVSLDDEEAPERNWIGINQVLSNRLIEYFFKNHALDTVEADFTEIRREVKLGQSKLDFKVGDTYVEVKTPLNTLQVKYGKHVRTKPQTPFSSTDRMVKHIRELTASLQSHERAAMLVVSQYVVTERKERPHSTNYEEVKETFAAALRAGVSFYDVEMKFTPEGVALYKVSQSVL